MTKTRKSWQEKLADDKGLPKVEPLEGRMVAKWGTGTICIPAPREVDAIMHQVPKGKLITINQIREIVAQRHGATIGCPLTTGIFANIAAHAAEEAAAEGKRNITPWWRTIKAGGELNEKFPGGMESQASHLRAEGHEIQAKGKKKRVKDYEAKIVKT